MRDVRMNRASSWRSRSRRSGTWMRRVSSFFIVRKNRSITEMLVLGPRHYRSEGVVAEGQNVEDRGLGPTVPGAREGNLS